MGKTRRSLVMALAVIALLLLAQPVLADGRSHTVFGQEYTLAAGERLRGDLVVLGGIVHLQPNSAVDGNVTMMGGKTSIEGNVRGDVVSIGGTLELGASAEIEGDLVTFGNVRRHPEATVRGELVTGPDAVAASGRQFEELSRMFDERVTLPSRPEIPSRPSEDWTWFGTLVRQIMALGAILAAAALVSILFPGNLARVTDAMTSAWLQSIGVGALTGIVAIVLAPVLAITCIGLPVSFVILVTLGMSLLLGWIGVGHRVGARVARVVNPRPFSLLAETMLGVGLITLVAMLPCLGLLAALPVAAWGLGAVVLTRFGTRAYIPIVPTPTPGGGIPPTPTTPRGDTRPLETPADAERAGDGA